MNSSPHYALGHSVGLSAFVWGYPLTEMMRTCRLQTGNAPGEPAAWAAPLGQLHHVTRPADAGDRDVITPANDLLYTSAWINLAEGPCVLTVPSSSAHAGRYFVLALYDAWTNNFLNPGLRESPPDGERVMLVGPGAPDPGPTPQGTRVLRSPTNLVWLLARVVTGEGDDLAAARSLQAGILLEREAPAPMSLPSGVAHWSGSAARDLIALSRQGDQRPEDLADHFLRNLCRALAQECIPAGELGLWAYFGHAGLRAHPEFDVTEVNPEVLSGLRDGVSAGIALVGADPQARRKPRPWTAHFSSGRYGTHYLARAITAFRGLGALAPEEAIYAMGDYDAAGEPLEGRHRYAMRFEADDPPPADAFWSVTLYDADRFLSPNAMGRHSIGDRTGGLVRDSDGGLTLWIGHDRPPQSGNWLPAPPGRFHVVMRLYSPQSSVRTWRIPPLTRVDSGSTLS